MDINQRLDEQVNQYLDNMKELDCKCCCGCGVTSTYSHHHCSITMKGVMAWCYHPSQGEVEGFGSSAMCRGCYEKRANLTNELGEQLEQPSTEMCCCGCGNMANSSTHYCIHTGRKIMENCYHPSQALQQEKHNKALCKTCFDTIAPKNGTPKRRAL